jgi:hypothetical protein
VDQVAVSAAIVLKAFVTGFVILEKRVQIVPTVHHLIVVETVSAAEKKIVISARLIVVSLLQLKLTAQMV